MTQYKETRNRDWLHHDVQARTGHPAGVVADVTQAVLDSIVSAVAQGEVVSLTGFGRIEKVHREARKGWNPKTGVTVQIPAQPGVKFKASPLWLEYARDPSSIPTTGPVAGRKRAS